jgi:hypothetical protein
LREGAVLVDGGDETGAGGPAVAVAAGAGTGCAAVKVSGNVAGVTAVVVSVGVTVVSGESK